MCGITTLISIFHSSFTLFENNRQISPSFSLQHHAPMQGYSGECIQIPFSGKIVVMTVVELPGTETLESHQALRQTTNRKMGNTDIKAQKESKTTPGPDLTPLWTNRVIK